jgi:WD40 repeat protein/class 3 adenylate cyclase
MAVQPGVQAPFQELPEGTVTFLFTDIEGSTQLLHRLREDYALLLADHHRLLREAFASWGGREMGTEGDAFFVAFPKATQAVAAAAGAQRALAEHPWPEGVSVRVRMGAHTGEPWVAEEGYVGIDVHRAARIAHVGHGGQVLLSETTAALVVDELPEGVDILDLGRHLLKDMRRPEHIRQLVIEGLASDFPPLTSQAVLPAESERPAREVGECPYRGLAAFREADAPYYFGRERFVDVLEEAVRTQPFVAVIVGSSGSGKSSALFAGLLPRLKQEPGWRVAALRPGAQPFYALAGTLLPLLETELSKTDFLVETRKLADRLAGGDIGLLEAVDKVTEDAGGEHRLLLVMDQFEELYTLCPDEALQHKLIDQLLEVVAVGRGQRRPPCVVLLTMRADFMGQALAYRPFADALQEASLLMGPMNREELRAAVEKPAEKQGAAFEAGLVERVLDDVGRRPGALPLLEFTLTQLWEAQDDGWLSHDDYEALGGVEGALASYADQVYESLSKEEQEDARRALIQLVRPGEGTEDTRRVATREELGDDKWGLLQHLADQRLVVTGRDAEGRETAEVVHEALIQRWGRFREWMESDRAFRAWQERLRANLGQWGESDEDEGALLSGAPLSVANQWLDEREVDLSRPEAAYIQESQIQQERREAERDRRRRRTVLALVAGLILAAGLATFAYYQRQNAVVERQNSQQQAAILLAGQAESELAAGYHDRAVLLALEALEKFPYTSRAEHALGQTVLYNRALEQYNGHSSAVTSVAWSPDGRQVASSAGVDNSVHIWDPATGETLQAFDLPTGITGNIRDMALKVAWTPDGGRLLVMAGDRYLLGSQDFDLLILDADNGELLSSVEIPNQVEAASGELVVSFTLYPTGAAAAIAPGSGRLATLGGDNTALIWDEGWGAPDVILRGHEDAVNSVGWSPDGMELVTAGMDGTARVWDPESGEERLLIQGHEGRIIVAGWSPAGEMLATAGEDGTVRLWNAADGSLVRLLEPGTESMWSVAWSPDGTRLATGHHEGQIAIWDVATGDLLETLAGHQGQISDLVWSPDGDRLASSDNSGFARVWDGAPSTAWRTLPVFYSQGLDWSSDSRYLAVAGGDVLGDAEPPSFSIFEVEPDRAVSEGLAAELNYDAMFAFFSPDDQAILYGGFAGFPDFSGLQTIYTLDPWNGEFLKTFSAEEGNLLRSYNWSPDGSQVAGGMFWSNDIWVWDYQSGEIIQKLSPANSDMMVNFVAWSPDGSKLGSADAEGTARVWDARSWELLYTITGHEPPAEVNSVNWSPDGSKLVTASGADEAGAKDNTARIWDADSGEELLVLRGHTKAVFSAIWSPDGRRIVTASTDNTVRIWDAESGDELLTLSPPPAAYGLSIAWSPDGHFLATSGLGSQVSVWRVWQTQEELVEYARECCLFRELTAEERGRFGLGGE